MRLAVGLVSASLVVLFGGPFPSARAELRAAPQTQAPVQPARPPAAQPPRDVSAPKTGTGVIRGRITDGETGRPLRRARLTVASPELGRDSRIVNTNAEGRYEVKDLPAGRYTVSVRRGGYLPLRYGQRRPYEQGKPLEIADKQVVERIDFALPRMSVISGRVTDETGDPIENVNVMALRSMFFNGRRQLVPTGGLQNTDDVGEYRISGLVPGTYLVMARASDKWIVDVNGREETMGYTPTYYPGIDRVADARKITIGVGKEAAAIDFSLIPGRAATVSGTAYNSKGQPFNRVSLGQEIRGDGFASFGGSGGGSSVVAPDGTFSIPNSTPGDYKLTASTLQESGPGPEAEVALIRLIVEGSDITGISLIGSGGGTVRGQLTTDDGSALPRNVRLTIQERLSGQPDPAILGAFRNSGIAIVQDEGTFEVKHVFSPARFEVTPPDGWAVKTITQNSRDITDQPVQLAHGQELSGVEVVLTSRLTTVTGELTDEKGAPADGTLIVFAADSAKWFDGSRFIRATRPDQAGRSQIKGLPPGEYLAVGVDYVEDSMWYDAEYLASIREHGRRVTLREGETQSLSVKVVP